MYNERPDTEERKLFTFAIDGRRTSEHTPSSSQKYIIDFSLDKIHYRVRINRGGDVGSRELDIHLQALSYLMTTVIHRLHETGLVWWQELLKEIKDEKRAIVRGTAGADEADAVLTRAISIVEHSLASQDTGTET